MKIAFVTDVVYPYIKGGAEKRVYELSGRLALSGHEVHVYSVKWWDGPSIMVKDGITYHGVCKRRQLYTAGGRRSVLEALAFAAALLLPLLKERFDVIDCNQHPYFSIFSCKLARLLKGGHFYVTWHEAWGNYWYEYMGAPGFFGKLVESITARLPDRIIAVSDRTAADLMKMGIRREKIVTVPNGFSYVVIKAVPPSGETYDVVFSGRLIKDKHVDVLLKACAVASAAMPLKVLIIGDGPERPGLEALCSSLRMNGTVSFAGAVEESRLISSIKAARVFILPSTREGFSIMTLEALACGVPVITVTGEKNSAQELIENGVNGLIVPLSEAELGEAIVRILSDENTRQLMAARCATSIGRFDWDLLEEKLVECYARQ